MQSGIGSQEMAFIVGIFVVVVIALVPMIFYLLTLMNALRAVRPENRSMEPGLVWLQLIPVFGMVWQFIIVSKMQDSLRKEFAARGFSDPGGDFGFNLGMTYCAFFVAGIIPYLGTLLSLVGIVIWIIYWVKIAGYKNMLLSGQQLFGTDTSVAGLERQDQASFPYQPPSGGDLR